jgi:predicted PurR-regulated permease PerM
MTQPPLNILPNWTTRQVIGATLVVVLVLLGFWLLYQLRLAVFILFTAIVISTALKPLVDWLHSRGVSPFFGVISVYVVFFIVLTGLLWLLIPALFAQISGIINEVPAYYQSFLDMFSKSRNIILQQLAFRLPHELPWSIFMNTAPTEPAEATAPSTNFIGLTLKGLFITIATLLLSLFWTLEGKRAIRSTLMLAPLDRREGIRELVDTIQDKMGAYVRSQAILAGVIGVMALVAYLLIGLPYALALAFFAGLMEVVPYVGPVLGAVPAVLVAASFAPSQAIWVIVASIIIQQIENTFLVPRIMNKSVGVNPIVALPAIFTFSSLLGIMGALLAIPIAAILQLLLDRFMLGPTPMDQDVSTGRDGLSRLRFEVQDLIQDARRQSRQNDKNLIEEDDPLEEEIEAIAGDLDSLLAQLEAPEVTP